MSIVSGSRQEIFVISTVEMAGLVVSKEDVELIKSATCVTARWDF